MADATKLCQDLSNKCACTCRNIKDENVLLAAKLGISSAYSIRQRAGSRRRLALAGMDESEARGRRHGRCATPLSARLRANGWRIRIHYASWQAGDAVGGSIKAL